MFEVFGSLERNMLPQEKVADAMFKWEKYAISTHSPKMLKLTFKVHTPSDDAMECDHLEYLHLQKRLFVKPYLSHENPVEFNLLLHQVSYQIQVSLSIRMSCPQAIDDVVNDKFPVSVEEAVYLAALRAQVTLGNFTDSADLVDYV